MGSSSADMARAVERRRDPRFACGIGITMEWGAAAIEGHVVDLSAGGMFVEIAEPLWVGARFQAQLAFAF